MVYWHRIKNIYIIVMSNGLNYFRTIISVPNSQWQTRKEDIAHVRTQELGLREILVIPPVDRSTSIPSRDRRVISENVRIGQNYPCEGTCPQGTSTSNRRDYPEERSEDNRLYRS